MRNFGKVLFTLLAAGLAATGIVAPSYAQDVRAATQAVRPLRPAVYYNWMSLDVPLAWRNQYYGQGTTITFIDDFRSADRFSGRLGSKTQTLRHGEWTSLEAGLIALSATVRLKDFSTWNTSVSLASGLNVLNLSYGMYAPQGYSSVSWGRQEASIISYATSGRAVISKAAGNDAIPVGGVTWDGYQDYLDLALIGTQSTIFAGALDRNGSVNNPAGMAWYSNTAGNDTRVQSHFLVVGVDGSKTGLYGTSFAAPIISGYAAIIGSKFKTATPTQITNKLLDTARTNTLLNYNATTYGRGEACLSCALAPLSIK